MNREFGIHFSMGIIVTKDLKRILLHKCSSGKLDGFVMENSDSDMNTVEFTKAVFDEIDAKIDPKCWQILTRLSNIEKKWAMDVYIAAYDLDNLKLRDDYIIYSTDDLPSECHPNLKWLIPMAIDFTVFGCTFNQILMK